MTLLTVQRVLGVFLAMFSLTMLPPVGVALIFDDGTWSVFAKSFAVIFALGFLLWWPVRRQHRELRLRDGFVVVAAFWVVLGFFGAVPFLLTRVPDMTFTDAVFESMAGLTTTGATVLVGLDDLAPAVLYYRHQLQWFGGLGLIVLAVAVLPMLRVGGMQLYRAEVPGPVKDQKLTPRITQTAKALSYIYLGITFACGFAYWLAGMTVFDAVCHSFSTVAIGGFSTHDASLGYFDSVAVEAIAIVFMIIAGVNFSLHFVVWREKNVMHYMQDSEFRAYCGFLLLLAVLAVSYLMYSQYYQNASDAFRHGLFQVVSIATTTGFVTDTFSTWPGALPMLLIYASFVGGCAGSTAGGMKVVRWLLMYKQGAREFQRLVHPSAEIPVKLGQKGVHPRVVDSVWGFFAIYIVVFAILMLILLSTELDPVSSFSAVAATLNNLGPGLGQVAWTFGDITAVAKWAAVCAMLLGRLEIFTLLVLITPAFWRR